MKEALDFLVIGAQKAGTTSLFEYLRGHPELTLPVNKEAPYFSHDPTIALGWESYLSKAFFDAPVDTKWGTVTPQYMYGGILDAANPTPTGETYNEFTVPTRIFRALPDVRLIAVLRDPVERAQSDHRMYFMNAVDTHSFDESVSELLRPDMLAAARRAPREGNGHVVWGEYGRVLAPYYALFGEARILVLFTDELEAEPALTLRRIYDFVGVRNDWLPSNLGRRYRVGATERRFPRLARINSYTVPSALSRYPVAKRVWRALPERRRRQIDRAVARANEAWDLWNRRSQGGAATVVAPVVERLRAHYAEDTALLISLIGRQPPWVRHGQ